MRRDDAPAQLLLLIHARLLFIDAIPMPSNDINNPSVALVEEGDGFMEDSVVEGR